MTDLFKINIHITIQPSSVNVCKRHTTPSENVMQCKFWVQYSYQKCIKHGCLNSLLNQGKEAMS